jgi:hypothetical protein
VQRQRRLLRIPSACDPGGNRLTARDFDPEALEAQGARAIERGIVVIVLKSVTRFAFAAAGAHHTTRGRFGRGLRPCPLERELLFRIRLTS